MTPLQLLSMECRSHCPQLQMLETCSKARYEGPQQISQAVTCNNAEACQFIQAVGLHTVAEEEQEEGYKTLPANTDTRDPN